MGRVVRADHDGHDVRIGQKRAAVVGADRRAGARHLLAREVGHPGTRPAVAHDADRPRLRIGDATGKQVGERILGPGHADTGGGGVTEHDDVEPLRIGRLAHRRHDDVVDREARPAGKELHAPQAHELHRDDPGERAGGGAEDSGDRDEKTIHVGTVARDAR